MKQLLLIYFTIGALLCGLGGHSNAQTMDATAIIQFNNGQSITVTDFSEPVGIMPGSNTQLTLTVPGTEPGESVNVGSLDGGRLIASDSVVSENGTISFVFQATANFGLNRVEVRHGTGKFRLQFWVLDTVTAQNNPPVITAATPEG